MPGPVFGEHVTVASEVNRVHLAEALSVGAHRIEHTRSRDPHW
jgi:hypothetical protein